MEAQEQEWPPVLFTVCSCQMDMTSRVSLCNVCVRLCQTAGWESHVNFRLNFLAQAASLIHMQTDFCADEKQMFFGVDNIRYIQHEGNLKTITF